MPPAKPIIFLRRLRRRATRVLRSVFRRPAFRIGVVIGVLALISSWLLFLVESREDPAGPYGTYFHTVQQVGIMLFSGYDIDKPSSSTGYALSMFCMFLGIGLIALMTADLASLLVAVAMAGVGRQRVQASNHVVICGWHYMRAVLVEQLTDREVGAHHEIVIVDEEPPAPPINDPDVHFVRGDPTEVEVLRRASVQNAHTAIVPIDWDLPEALQDPRTTLSVMAVKAISQEVYVCAEILKHHNRRHLERTGVDEIVCVGELSQKLVSQAALTHGLSKLIDELLTFTHQSEIYKVALPAELAGRTFRWLLRTINKSQQAILLSVHRGAQTHVNPPGEFPLQAGDELFILATNRPSELRSLGERSDGRDRDDA